MLVKFDRTFDLNTRIKINAWIVQLLEIARYIFISIDICTDIQVFGSKFELDYPQLSIYREKKGWHTLTVSA